MPLVSFRENPENGEDVMGCRIVAIVFALSAARFTRGQPMDTMFGVFVVATRSLFKLFFAAPTRALCGKHGAKVELWIVHMRQGNGEDATTIIPYHSPILLHTTLCLLRPSCLVK